MIKSLTFYFLLFLFLTPKLFAQGNYGGGVDDQNLHFGFNFQYVNSEYKIQKIPSWRAPFLEGGIQVTDSLNSIRSIPNPGFGIGFVTDLYITPNLNLRFTPSLIFADRIIDYQFKDGMSRDQSGVQSPSGFTRRTVQSTMVEFPVGIKLKSDRRNNFRAYLLAGAKYGIDVASSKKAQDAGEIAINKFLKNKKGILSYEVAIGFDLYFEFFKLSPEIKLSNSVNSILKRDDTPYASPIEKLFLRNFVFSLYFE
ncbi:MAG: PorT family protein [Bacteroidetes bacterium]|nr:PorT family protein [Bacteroidota bacterium]MBU1373193.1 PorT family protein [Bacteroidota bacterium]MBU1486265.1 PorT family protein [Bacteroidota bacterium]MBU1761324.1 PorT family protein [Bacteroidota bacterium]MBU2266889.1 PorT family protein [Bacteroidota bacterium]